ncbi:MAG: TonB family protein [Spirochaetales bacterium]|nr:MAG: TonB family protein [Spirochaetales bacterium]
MTGFISAAGRNRKLPLALRTTVCVTAIILLGCGLIWGRQEFDTPIPIVLKPVKTVYPKYPDHLKKEGIAGEVIVSVWVDEKGNVKIASKPFHIIRSLHPELDELAVSAAKEWKFAPLIVPKKNNFDGVGNFLSFLFDPGESSEVEDAAPREPLSRELLTLLDRSWASCEKMEDVADFYLCRERIKENIKNIVNVGDGFMWGTPDDIDAGEMWRFQVYCFVPDLGLPKTNRYINEYQITSRNSRVTELRTPAKPLSNERNSMYEKKPLSFPIPMSVSSRLLAPGFRDEYDYFFGEDEKILGKNCRVIEIMARKKKSAPIRKATVWVERKSDRVVKAEVECGETAIDKRILAECRELYLVPHMTATYEYDNDIKGIRLPSQSKIVLDYSQLGRRNKRDTRIKLAISYDKYRFFTVSTEPKIIK